MKVIGKFILLEINEFDSWLNRQTFTRRINLIQQHHTYIPSYQLFNNDNHFELCNSMERAHLKRKFAEIAQNLTTFPDGKIMICRNLNTIPAGIKGANTYGICIENLGYFDIGKDVMTTNQTKSIIEITKSLLRKFKLVASDKSVVYHHWYDLDLARRINQEGTGTTKSCPGTNFFGGNTVTDFNNNFLPLLNS